LTFTPDNWFIPQAITVTAIDDDVVENKHFGIISHTIRSTDPDFDGVLVDSVLVSVTDNDQTGENHAPILIVPAEMTVGICDTVTFHVTATDVDGDFLTLTAADLPAGATFELVGESGSGFVEGVFTWSPAHDQPGTFTVTFTANDGRDTPESVVTESVTITVISAQEVLRGLIDRVEVLEAMGFEPAHGLRAELEAALASVVREDRQASIGQLGAAENTIAGLLQQPLDETLRDDLEQLLPEIAGLLLCLQAPVPPVTAGPTVVPGRSAYFFTVSFAPVVNDRIRDVRWMTDTPAVAVRISSEPTHPGMRDDVTDGLQALFTFANQAVRLRIWVQYTITGPAGAINVTSRSIIVDVVHITVGPAPGAGRLTFNPATDFVIDRRIAGGNIAVVPEIAAGGLRFSFGWAALITGTAPAANPNALGSIRVGYVQHVTPIRWRATYQDGTTRRANFEGTRLLDLAAGFERFRPFYASQRFLVGGGATPLSRNYAFPATGMVDIGANDRPTPVVEPRFNMSPIVRQEIEWRFVLDVVTITDTDAAGGSPDRLFPQARAIWTLNTTGTFDPATGNFTPTGRLITAPTAWESFTTAARLVPADEIANRIFARLNWIVIP
jgi:hypothetical protein